MPGVGIQVPPNLADWWPRARRGGRDRPRRAERQRRPHLARAPVPVAAPGAQAPAARRRRADRAAVRLPAVHRPGVGRPGRARRRSRRSTGSFIPRRGSGRTRAAAADPAATSSPARSRGRATAPALEPDELTALFAETRPEAIEDMRQAADELRAELAGETVTFVVNRNINVSNVCIVGCAFCGFGQGKRSPDAYEHDREEFVAPRARGGRLRRDRDLHPVGHPPRLGARGLPAAGCASPRTTRAGASTCTPTARWRSRTCATSPGCRPTRCSRGCATRASDSTPGTAAEVLHDGVRERISPNKLPVARWVEIIEATPPRRAALDRRR